LTPITPWLSRSLRAPARANLRLLYRKGVQPRDGSSRRPRRRGEGRTHLAAASLCNRSWLAVSLLVLELSHVTSGALQTTIAASADRNISSGKDRISFDATVAAVHKQHRRAHRHTIKDGDPNRIILTLYGERYDVSPVLEWHPGGTAILRQARALRHVDSTPLFESQHALRDPNEMRRKLIPYRLNGTHDATQLYSFADGGFYRAVRARVAKALREQSPGSAPKGGCGMVVKYALIMCLSFLFLRWGARATSACTMALWAFWGGFFCFAANAFNLLHDASHFGAFTRRPELTIFASRLSQAMVWWDHAIWRAHHVLSHHPFTGDVRYDPDMRHGQGAFCKGPEEYLCDLNRVTADVQFWMAITQLWSGQSFLYRVIGIFDLFPSLRGGAARRSITQNTLQTVDQWRARSYFQHANGLLELREVELESWRWWQYAVACWIPLFVAAVARSVVRRTGSVRLACVYAVAALAMVVLGANVSYSINILIDHDALETQQLVGQNHLQTRDWGEVQLRGTANWAGPIWCAVFGGINYQIEHHLFPTVYHMHYPTIAPIVRATAEAHGIPYLHFASVTEGLVSVREAFRAAASTHEPPVRPVGNNFMLIFGVVLMAVDSGVLLALLLTMCWLAHRRDLRDAADRQPLVMDEESF